MTGTGTIGDPYIITTRADLEAVNDHLDAYYELGADVDLAGSDWTPIGVEYAEFTGHLDGKYHKITGMTIYTPQTDEWYGYGLFGYASGTFKDVAICGANIFMRSAGAGWSEGVGILCGWATLGFEASGCTVSGTITNDGDGFVRSIGGIVGAYYPESSSYLIATIASSCRATVTIVEINPTVNYEYGLEAVGAIAGYVASWDDIDLVVCDCIGSLTTSGDHITLLSFAGGLIGWAFTGVYGPGGPSSCYVNITGCTAMVDLDEQHADCYVDCGGFIGFTQGTVHISDCHASGIIYGGWIVGGFAGEFSCQMAQYGGPNIIERCSADVDITAYDEDIGGFVGEIYANIDGAITFTDCYALGSINITDAPWSQEGYDGGFSGWTYVCTVSYIHCYAAVLITLVAGILYYGGFNARNQYDSPPTIDACYWDTEVSEQSVGVDAVGKTTAQMQTQSTFSGWDFDTVWNIASGTYPFLRTAFVTLTDGCASAIAGVIKSFPWWKQFRALCKVKEA